MSKSSKRHRSHSRSRSRSRSTERRDKEKKRHRHRDDKHDNDHDKRKRSKGEHDRCKERDRDKDHHHGSSGGGSRKHSDYRDRDRGREKDRDRGREKDRDRDRKYSRKHHGDASDKDDSDQTTVQHMGAGVGGASGGVSDSVATIAARISEKALSATKSRDDLENAKKDKDEHIQQQRRDRLQAWREAQNPPAPSVDDKTSPDSGGGQLLHSDILPLSGSAAAPLTTVPPLSLSLTVASAKKPIALSSAGVVGVTPTLSPATSARRGGGVLFGGEEDTEEIGPASGDKGVDNGVGNDVEVNKNGHASEDEDSDFDPLDAFMSSLYDTGDVTEQFEEDPKPTRISHGTGHSNSAAPLASAKSAIRGINPNGSNFITLEQITSAGAAASRRKKRPKDSDNDKTGTQETDTDTEADTASVSSRVYDPADWKSDVSFSPAPGVSSSSLSLAEREEQEEKERRDFLEALRDASLPPTSRVPTMGATTEREGEREGGGDGPKEEKEEGHEQELGRIFAGEGDMIEESEVAAKKKSALDVLEEQRRGKELRPVDHVALQQLGAQGGGYAPFRKNLYIVPRVLGRLSPEELRLKRDALQMKVRGKGCPAPVDTWDQCGLSERMLSVIKKHNFEAPFSIQKQALPAIMCGRDIIAVAKTGSGKTLAFLLPMFRHILDQPPLRESEGPIGIIMAPARELAFQIYNEAKKFTKALGLTAACVYGGAGVADQIADLKRGADIVVCTPGRMIDILCMQAGKLVTLRRVTMVVMDEADRMFDMGFEPQIKMILQNIRPDRQTVLFSATFPKQIEKLAKSVLQYPLEIVVGERSTANKDITQVIEVHEPEDKYMRLLQLLGIWYERGSVLIFVDKQETCDQLFQDLLKSGYPCVSLHGGKDQLDRDHTLHEFKSGVKTVMVATSVAGRGLDVPEIVCVINYHCPNHMEDYVHRVGRTGRAGRKGTAYTFIAPSEEQHAPTMLAVLQKAGVTGDDVPQELVAMAESFKAKVQRGEAHWSSNGFSGSKGFSFDSSEMNEAQKLASLQRRAYEIEQGIVSDRAGEEGEGEDAADEFYEQGGGEDEGRGSATSTVLPPPVAPVHDSSGTALVVVPGGSSSASSEGGAQSTSAPPTQLAALEKARALAVSMGISTAAGGGAGAIPTPPPGQPLLTADGKVDTNAALQRARQIAMQMAGGTEDSMLGAVQREEQQHFSEDLEINDYPANVRRKVTMRSTLDEVTDRTGTNIISRGSYVAPGKKPEVGERKLFLLIEGPTEMQVKQARLEVVRLLEEETLRQGASGQSFSGRYSVT